MKRKSTALGGEIGKQVQQNPNSFVQVSRRAMEEWGKLLARKPTAGRLLMWLTSNMADRNAVVVSQKTMAKALGVSDRTIKSAVADLTAERWIQTVQLNGPGTVNGYVVNSRVAWGQKRDDLRLSLFHAMVVADQADQQLTTLDTSPLRQIPVLYAGEQQLAAGDGLPPPSQPFLDGMEPDLPAIEHDPETGEIIDIEDMIGRTASALRAQDD